MVTMVIQDLMLESSWMNLGVRVLIFPGKHSFYLGTLVNY